MENESENLKFTRFVDFFNNSWKVLRVIISVVLCLVLLEFLLREFVPPQDTYGSISVDSPEVYTRERLVNDRFLQDAWLKKQLNEIGKFKASSSYQQDKTQKDFHNKQTDPQKSQNVTDLVKQEKPLEMSSAAKFIDMVDYWDTVRSQKIENQLDDRHDLNGNTLYRLKFDATIIPGNSTRALARIEVKLKGPKCIDEDDVKCISPETEYIDSTEETKNQMRGVYNRWLLNLQARLNQTHREQKEAFHNNDYKKPDYIRLRKFAKTYYDINLEELEECAAYDVLDNTDQPAVLQNQLEYSYSIDHEKERACILSIVKKIYNNEEKVSRSGHYSEEYAISFENDSDPENSSALLDNTEPVQSYIIPETQEDEPIPVSEATIAARLEKYLNTFLAAKTLQLVLGLNIPPSEFIKNDLYELYSIDQLKPLTEISFFSTELNRTDYKVFVVEEKSPEIHAISSKLYEDEESFRALAHNPNNSWFRSTSKADYVLLPENDNKSPEQERPTKLYVLKNDLQYLLNESYELGYSDFTEDSTASGVFMAKTEVGLQNFAKHAQSQTNSYAYAVTPKMRAINQYTSTENSTEASSDIPWISGFHARFGREQATQTVNRKGTVVGFAKGTGEKETVFGWVMGPTLSVAGNRYKVHAPIQQSLSALVSLPSWWTIARLTVTTNWVGLDGGIKEANQKPKSEQYEPDDISDKGQNKSSTLRRQKLSDENTYQIDLPTNYEQLEAAMLKLQQFGPVVMESMLDRIQLTACQDGAIVIPGRRLWRSTVVTMGNQTADEISVLPNMKGIIARFKPVENQMSVEEENIFHEEETHPYAGVTIERAVRVWTSQGTVGLPEPAYIGIPKSCRNESKTDTTKETGG